jgi:hypothetical protein
LVAPSVVLVTCVVKVVTVAIPVHLHPRAAASLDYWR